MAVIFGNTPDPSVIDAFEAGSVRVVRWVDIYEKDNVTIWRSQVPLTDGNISVDASRDERRNLDLTLLDENGELGYGPGELWYDKIVKPYRGIVLPEKDVSGYIFLPGVAGNAVTFTRTDLVTVTAVEFAVRVLLSAVGAAQPLAGWNGGGGGLSLTTLNKLNIGIAKTTSGTIGGADSSVAVPGINTTDKIWLRGIVTVSTAVCQYYYSKTDTSDYDQVVWTQVGTNVTGTNAAGAVDVSKTDTPVFGSTDLTVTGFAGRLYAGAELINTAKTIEFDASDYSAS
jgi:hypothetical protein